MRRAIFVTSLALFSSTVWSSENPNIIYVLCDDLGYGDVSCLNSENGKIPTPHTDRLASEGMVFTDAHSGSSVCTPTRYGLLTGRYSWRSKLQSGVVTGFDSCLIPVDRPNVASFLRQNGYHTAIIGKWHLNFRYLHPESGEEYLRKQYNIPPVGAYIPDGPIHRGFDYFHGFHHARDMEAVIENKVVIAHDPPANMLPRLTSESVNYIRSRKGKKKPFFLYLSLNSPHTPILPSPEWKGRSGLGKYGDFVMQTDHVMGELGNALSFIGQEENTLVFFTSDNGCSKAAGIKELAGKGHLVSAQFRGSKADLWEGGHRVPLIVKWPKRIKAGSICDQLVCLTDFFATAADIIREEIPPGSCEDSLSFLPALLGKKNGLVRRGVIHHSISGHFAYRREKWKLLLAKGSGGWTFPQEKKASPESPPAQLYDLGSDLGEKRNLYEQKTELAKKLLSHLREDVEKGRSTPGPKSGNDLNKIILWKNVSR